MCVLSVPATKCRYKMCISDLLMQACARGHCGFDSHNACGRLSVLRGLGPGALRSPCHLSAVAHAAACVQPLPRQQPVGRAPTARARHRRRLHFTSPPPQAPVLQASCCLRACPACLTGRLVRLPWLWRCSSVLRDVCLPLRARALCCVPAFARTRAHAQVACRRSAQEADLAWHPPQPRAPSHARACACSRPPHCVLACLRPGGLAGDGVRAGSRGRHPQWPHAHGQREAAERVLQLPVAGGRAGHGGGGPRPHGPRRHGDARRPCGQLVAQVRA